MVFEKDIESKNEFLYKKNKISVYIKREDLLHKHISGNKFRKLKYNIRSARIQNNKTLLTFGGAFSNHITATAYTGKIFGFNTIGVIRGEELGKNLENTLNNNPSLKFAFNCGMQFKFITRDDYKKKTDTNFINNLRKTLDNFYLIPEGGTNSLAIKGCQEILTKKDKKFDYICVAVGTGGTVSGLIKTANKNQKVLGFSALKGDFLNNNISNMVEEKANWELITNYHFGGFAKINNQLITFMNTFKKELGIALDPIYTAKLFFGIDDLIEKSYFKENTKILAIHTGGLQGIEGMNKKLRNKGLKTII
ncbi:MAG: pyridoxal-phosphate dependent enzyme [Flavobacteriaceae bacterium]|nr:pyridoxal-phosphate dependent enzyme [Flavobacteriaceae bacterium]